MAHSYWDELKKIFYNKALIFVVIITTIMCFGFTITNFSIGIDDPAAYHYLWTDHYGSMIQQGRLLHVLYNLLTGTLEFLPFFNDFLGAGLLALSSLLFCALFQGITKGKLSSLVMAVFCCVYISTPIINEKFIYNLDVVVTMSSYCTVALALMYVQYISDSRINFIKAVALLMLSIASYETFAFVYFCGVFAIFILRIVVNQEKLNGKTIIFDGIKYAAVLICAFIVYYGIVFCVQLLTGQYGVFSRYNGWTDMSGGLVVHFINLTKTIAAHFLLSSYFPLTEIVFFAVLGFILFLILSVRKKDIWLSICYVALFAGNLLIHYICGYVMNRASQTICFFIAFVAMIFVFTVSGNVRWKKMVVCASVLLVLVQSAELNRWFYNDYIRYEKERFAVNAIATDLLKECDVSKPVVFTDHVSDDGYLNTYYYSGDQVNGNSVIYWADETFEEYDYSMMHQLFRMHGYDFLVAPSEQQAMQAKIESEKMPAWPREGCIVETEEYIIVNIR